MARSKGQQVRAFVFTWNNYPPDAAQQIFHSLEHRYAVVGYEVSQNGTPHIQGYMQLTKRKTLRVLGGMFPWHVECSYASPVLASDYCKKGLQPHSEWQALQTRGPHYGLDARFEESGVLRSGSVEKTKAEDQWLDIYRRLQSVDHPLESLLADYPGVGIRYFQSLLRIRSFHTKSYVGVRSCYYLWGKTGVGKTRFCHENFPNAYFKDASVKWFDDYSGEDVVVIDELESDLASHGHYLKRWADRYPVRAEVKGGYTNLSHRILLVTSNESLWSIAKGNQVLHSCLSRRFTEIEVLGYDESLKAIKYGPVLPQLLTKQDILNKLHENNPNFLEG